MKKMNKEIYENLKSKLSLSYCPYSNVHVAAYAKTNDGKEFYGVNVENPAYPSGICAERACLFGSVAQGAKVGSFKEVHVISNSRGILYCCSGCLQVMTHFMEPNGMVHFYNITGDKYEVRSIKELVPFQVQDKDIRF